MNDKQLQEELRKRSMVAVEIPEADKDGCCSNSCQLKIFMLNYDNGYDVCSIDLNKETETSILYPGPKCPRYKEE